MNWIYKSSLHLYNNNAAIKVSISTELQKLSLSNIRCLKLTNPDKSTHLLNVFFGGCFYFYFSSQILSSSLFQR